MKTLLTFIYGLILLLLAFCLTLNMADNAWYVQLFKIIIMVILVTAGINKLEKATH